MRIINEPTAAALNTKQLRDVDQSHLLVIRLGSKISDLVGLNYEAGVFEVMMSEKLNCKLYLFLFLC